LPLGFFSDRLLEGSIKEGRNYYTEPYPSWGRNCGSGGVLLKPLDDPALGTGYMRVTTALPEDNARFLAILEEVLKRDGKEGV
jgi:hypothetical protein